MNTLHIIKFLDETKFGDLSAEQASKINAHIPDCPDCRQAFQAARLASLLLKEESALPALAPTAFFQTKVLNAWRESQNIQKPVAALLHWWRASATLVTLMFLLIIGLMAATFINPRYENAGIQTGNSDVTLYSAETVIFNEKPVRNLTTEQVYEVLDDNQ